MTIIEMDSQIAIYICNIRNKTIIEIISSIFVQKWKFLNKLLKFCKVKSLCSKQETQSTTSIIVLLVTMIMKLCVQFNLIHHLQSYIQHRHYIYVPVYSDYIVVYVIKTIFRHTYIQSSELPGM